MQYDIFETDLGWVAAVIGAAGLVRATLPEESPMDAWDAAQPDAAGAQQNAEALAEVRGLLQAYARGEDVDLSAVKLDLEGESPFFKRAWAACRSIPRGSVRTYGWLAAQSGSQHAIRAAGQAMARNKWALLVPCHRVVNASGDLHGFGGSQGLALKQRLLEMEGLRISRRQVVA